jgi:PAS domain S-box-containing protein
LVVDDEPTVLTLLTRILERGGFQVQGAASYDQAVARIKQGTFAAILSDVFIGVRSGIDLLRHVNANTEHTPVILVTGAPTINSALEAIRLGAYDYLLKPVVKEDLLVAVRRAVEVYHLRQAQTAVEAENKSYKVHLEQQVKERTQRLLESEKRYRVLFEGSRDAIFIADREGRMININQAALEMIGYSLDEIMAISGFELFVDQTQLTQFQEEILKEGAVHDFEARLLRRDGALIDALISASLSRDDEENIQGYHGIVRNVTLQKRSAKRIRQQKEFLETVVESLTHPFYVVDVESHRIVLANAAARQLGGGEGHTCYEITRHMTRECQGDDLPCPLDEVIRTRQPLMLEQHLCLPDGSQRHMEVYGYPIIDADGDVVQMIEYCLDVTRRRQVELELKKRDAILEAVRFVAEIFLESKRWEEGIDLALRQLGRTTGVSRVYIAEVQDVTQVPSPMYLRWDWAEETVMPKRQFWGSDAGANPEEPHDMDEWQKRLREGISIQGSYFDFSHQEQGWLQRQDIQATVVVPIFVEKKWWGLIGFDDCREPRIWSQAEVGALKVAAETLGAAIHHGERDQERHRLAAAIEQATDSITIMTTDGRVQYVNPAFSKISGFAREEVLGRRLTQLVRSKDSERLYPQIMQRLSKGLSWTGSANTWRKDRTAYVEESTLFPIKDAGGDLISIVAIQRDVTDKKRMESIIESASLMDNLGYIFTGLRHEIGNPLNSLKMSLTVLSKNINTFTQDRVVDFIDRGLDEVTRMEYLLKAFKNFSLYDSPEITRVSLSDFMSKFVGLIRDDFLQRDIRIVTHQEEASLSVAADTRMLHQVLLNLMTNAADALVDTPAARIDIHVQKHPPWVQLRVRDNGAGMTAEERSHVFTPFFTTKAKGTGLGMVIVRKMLVKMNAAIRLESEKGMGTTVMIDLPEAKDDA